MTAPRPTVRPGLPPDRVARLTARLDGLTAPSRALDPPDPVRAHLWTAGVHMYAAALALLVPVPSWAGGLLLGLGAAGCAGAVAVYARPRTFSPELGGPRWAAPVLFTALGLCLAAACAAAAHLLHLSVRELIAGPGAGAALLSAVLAVVALAGARHWSRDRRSVHGVDHITPHLLPATPWEPAAEEPGGLRATRPLNPREQALADLRACVDAFDELKRTGAPLPGAGGVLGRLRDHEWRAGRIMLLRRRRIRRDLARGPLPGPDPYAAEAAVLAPLARAALQAHRAVLAARGRGAKGRTVHALTAERDKRLRRLHPRIERILRWSRAAPAKPRPYEPARPLVRLLYAVAGLAALGAAWAALLYPAAGTVLLFASGPVVSACVLLWVRLRYAERWTPKRMAGMLLASGYITAMLSWGLYELWEAIAWWVATGLFFVARGDATVAFYLYLVAFFCWFLALTGWGRAHPLSRR
ncbi:hypothetical protein [Nocardiopsis changdeensis]|uniref:hypothetical protein n=1 Tax=Nocardiopsis changdeensis TaxID=2831969 RepID=UPI003F46F400